MEDRPFVEEWCAMWGPHSKRYYQNLTDTALLKIYEQLLDRQGEKMAKGEPS